MSLLGRYMHHVSRTHNNNNNNMMTIATTCTLMSKRKFFPMPTNWYSWLRDIFNKKDTDRLKKIGPDRACGEWIVRNGGRVKFLNHSSYTEKYGFLPQGDRNTGHKVVAVDAMGVEITERGLDHLEGLTELEMLKLNGCTQIYSLRCLKHVSNTIKYLDIGNCTNITDISPALQCSSLEVMVLTNSLHTKDRHTQIDNMKNGLPKCKIVDETVDTT